MYDTIEQSEIDRAIADLAESGRRDKKTRNDIAVLEAMKRARGLVIKPLAAGNRGVQHHIFVPEGVEEQGRPTGDSARVTESGAAELQRLEGILTSAKRWAMDEARALHSIGTKELWRATDFKSFEEYATTKWGYEQAHVYRLSKWGEVLCNLEKANPPIGGSLPSRESHARPLTKLKAEQQCESWREVCAISDSPTAELVAQVVADRRAKKDSVVETIREAPQGGSHVICADACDGLKTLPDDSIDFLLFSPPYAEQRKKDYPSVPEADFPAWMVAIFTAARPKLKAYGNIMVVAREHVKDGTISDYLLRTRLAVREAGFFEIDVLIWSKPDAPPTGRADRPRRAFEFIYWFSTGRKPYCDPKACGTPLIEPPERMTRHRSIKSGHHSADGFMRFTGEPIARVTDVIPAPVGGNSQGVKHPAPYPLGLCDKLIRTYSRPGGLVADVCCGSGTTLIAARDAGRTWFGCDVVEKYVEDAVARLAKATEQSSTAHRDATPIDDDAATNCVHTEEVSS